MAEPSLNTVFGIWNKLQEVFSPSASSSCLSFEHKPTKLNDMVYEVFRPPPGEKAELEVVFFHGLQLKDSKEAYVTTWMSHDNSEFWLSWLEEVFPKARVLTISYDSSPKRTNDAGRQDMYVTAENLLCDLTSDSVRVGEGGCPIVLVGHCLGGLVLKELCLSAGWMLGRNSEQLPRLQRIRDFFSNLRGMFFYATPHSGCLLGDKLQDYFQGPLLGPLLAEMEVLKASSSRRNEEFRQLQSRHGWITYGLGESDKTFVERIGYIHVVPEASTRPYMDSHYTARADHYTICKPEGKNAGTFVHVKNFLKQIHEEGVLQAKVVADAVGSGEYVIDLIGRAREVEKMLAKPDADTVFIVGMSGIGKTTLAKQIFRDISHSFSIPCFIQLDNIDPQSNTSEEILRKIQDSLNRPDKGWNYNQFNVLHYLQGKKSLIIVDNVESQDQLDALRKEIWLQGSASRLIVTTTNSQLGSESNIFQVPYLSEEESEQLFLHYAFEGTNEPQGLRKYIEQVIRKCSHFPLALKIIGRFAGKKDVRDRRLWLGLIDKLEKAEEVDGGPDYRLWGKLRLCYDALPRTERELFLDVATVFHGLPLNYVECIWSRCWGHSAYVALTNLKRRFLVSEESDGRLFMHAQLRNLGRSIACPPDTTVDKWKRVATLTSAKELIATCQGVADTSSLKIEVATNESLILRNTTFLPYTRLSHLILDGVETAGGTVELPRSLVYLRWTGALFDVCPVDFNGLENLAVLDLRGCRAMKVLPPSIVTAKKLLWLELEGCLSLTELPSKFIDFRELQYLGLSRTGLTKLPRKLGELKELLCFHANQTQLTRVPQSIGRLGMLLSLNISNSHVRVLPDSVGDLKFLRILDISNTSISLLPESIGQLQDLQILMASRTLVRGLPESLGNLVGLEILDLDYTPLEALPDSIVKLCSLWFLTLNQCEQLSRLPDAFGELAELQKLYLLGSGVRTLPETFRKLSRLQTLEGARLSSFGSENQHCPGTQATSLDQQSHVGSLVSLPFELRTRLGTNVIAGEESTMGPTRGQTQWSTISCPLPLLPPLNALYSLYITGAESKQFELSALFRALQQSPNLVELTLYQFKEVETMPFELGSLSGLQYLYIIDWKELRELPESMGQLSKLRILTLKDLPRICRLPDLGTPSMIMSVTHCGSLRSMPSSWGHVSSLERESSPSPADERTPSNWSPSPNHGSRPVSTICINSWSILRCLLECCSERCAVITFSVTCGTMKRLRETIVEERNKTGLSQISPKLSQISTKSLKELGLELYGGDDGVHEIFTSSTSWAPLASSDHCLLVQCRGENGYYGNICKLHYPVKVVDTPEETAEDVDIETDDDTEEEEGDTEI